jgi:hypothetical protein
MNPSILWVVFQLAVTAPAGTPANEQRDAMRYANEFVTNFVVRSCGETRCEFLADPRESRITATAGTFQVVLHGRRRQNGYQREEREVVARLTLKSLPSDTGLPAGWMVVDFSFIEGQSIPIPTK